MKRRISKKAYDCSHHVENRFMVTDDPYPMYQTEDYCKLGKYDFTDPPYANVNVHPCCNCNRYCASRPMIRKQRETKAFLKEVKRDWNRNYRAAVRAGVAQEEDGQISLDLVL